MGMTRRSFLRTGTLGGVAVAAAASSLSCGPSGGDAGQTGRAPSGGAGHDIPPFELEEKTFVELQQGMASGEWTARSIVEAYFERIESLDRKGPQLNQILETNPDALEIADGLDAERKDGKLRGPLHGVPILFKDNIGTDDKMMTTAGSLALVGAKVPRDAFLVERLRAAGAIVLGKTNLSEWANFRSTQSSSGWSGRGGQGKNPYALDRSPCGSSSGSGAATSASFCAAAIGTETDGSVVCPASINGIVGIKPTLGLVSRAGIIPLAHSQDTAGPMARTVADAAALLGSMTGVDPRDEATSAGADHTEPDYTAFLEPHALIGARIGVAREKYFGYSPEADAIVENAIQMMRDVGATIVDPADIPSAGKFDDGEFEVLLYEFKAGLDRYLGALGPESPVHSLADVIAFNEKNADREMRYFGQEIMLMAQEKGPLTDKAYRDALASNLRLSRKEGIDAVMAKYELDALVAPTGSPSWPIDLINGDHYIGSSSSPAAVSGYPAITVPAGYSFGLPVGISFFGGAWSEPKLIALAYSFEQADPARKIPMFAERASAT